MAVLPWVKQSWLARERYPFPPNPFLRRELVDTIGRVSAAFTAAQRRV
jgi:hypothetical protein